MKADLLSESHIYLIRKSELWESARISYKEGYQILTACSTYNLILQGKKQPNLSEKWKLIFHTDQSLL